MINITNISKRMMRSLSALLVLLLAQSSASFAQTRLYMEDFNITAGEKKQVSLILDNDQTATVMQVSIEFPEGLIPEPNSVALTSRVRRAGVEAAMNNDKLIIVETDGTIAAGSGAVITFEVEASGAMAEGTYPIKLSDIVISNAAAEQINEEEESEASVTVLGIANCAFGTTTEPIELAVGQEYQVDITLTNEGATTLSAFSGKLTLPEGLEIVEGEDGKFIYTERTPSPMSFQFKDYEGYTTFVLSSSGNKMIQGEEGVIFSFVVKATSALTEESKIVLSDLRVANTAGKSATCDDVTISVKNTSFEAYKVEQIEAVEALAEEGDSEATQKIITDAKAAIEAVEYDVEKTSFEDYKAAVDAIVEPVAEALAAQRAADQLAADKAAFEAYKAEQTAALEALAEEGDSEEAQAIIAAAVEAIEALEYDEEKTLEENEAAADEIVAPVAEALDAQRAADQLAADKAAFEAYKAEQTAALEALAEEGDSEEAQAIIAAAVEAIEALEYDEEKTLEENEAAVEELVAPVAEALDAQRAADQLAADKAAFEEFKAEQIAAVEALAEEDDSEATQAIIAEAIAAIEALEYDEEKTLEENMAEISGAVDFDELKEALEAQREADAIVVGDVNGDGQINTVDASYILMYLVGNAPEDFVEKAADVDGNGRIDTLDATAILKMLVE